MYKFRFVSSQLLANYRNVSVTATNKSLSVLVDTGHIGRKYNNSFKLQGKGAIYYLLPKSLRLLRDEYGLDNTVIHAMYKNRTVSQAFIDHNLRTLSAYLAVQKAYLNNFHVFTKYELTPFTYFPEPKPDLYLNCRVPAIDRPNEYILDICPDTQFFVLKKRLNALVEHFESGEWEAGSETDYPTVLFVCPDAAIERKLQMVAIKTLENMGIDELQIYTTTQKSLLASNNGSVWSSVYSPEQLISL